MEAEQPRRLNDGIERGRSLRFTFDGAPVEAYEGETVAAALLAAGVRMLRRSEKRNEPRGVFCGMGSCFECRMVIDGRMNVRACLTPVAGGMAVKTQRGPASHLAERDDG
jgi:predicted molibdopterin-dependent oxidoreductase YjgC